MKVSKLIQKEAEKIKVDCKILRGCQNGMFRSQQIAEEHEAEHGWQPIATAPKDRKHVVRDDDDWLYISEYWEPLKNWIDEECCVVFPTEWYNFPEDIDS